MRYKSINPAFIVAGIAALASGCGGGPRGSCRSDNCGTVVFAAPGEPSTLLPVMTDDALDRDIFDQVFLKLADIGPDGSTIGDKGFVPQLASKWEWTTPSTIVFHLDPRARWHDGQPVTANDVVFTWTIYTDSTIDSPYRSNLSHIRSVTATDSATVAFGFDHPYAEMFFDAVYHMRILPFHALRNVPPSGWHDAPFGRSPVGDGPYRFVRWTPGQTVELRADTNFFLGRPHLNRLIWRFSSDLTTAVTQVVAGEADAIQVLVTPTNIERAEKSGHLKLYSYPGSVYNTMGFNLHANGNRKLPHPIFADPAVRRALVLATDRQSMAQSVFHGHAKVPAGPVSEMWSGLWFSDLSPPAYDTAQANRMLEQDGWHRGSDGVRVRNGQRLAFHLAVPSSSGTRKQYAQLIQEQLRAVGAQVTIDEMENATIQERQRHGAYDAAMESWNTDPSPVSGIGDAWTTKGGTNFGGYSNPRFDEQVQRAVTAEHPNDALHAWHDALKILADDAPAIMLYALDNVAAVDQRIEHVSLRPDYWWATVRDWRIPAAHLVDRDRVAP